MYDNKLLIKNPFNKATLFLALSILLIAMSIPHAQANKTKKFSISSPDGFKKSPEIEVYSVNGEKYTDIDKTDQSKFLIKLNAECKYEGKGNKAYRGELKVPGYVPTSESKPANFLIPTSKEAYRIFRYENGKGQPLNPVNVCNSELQKRLSQNSDKTKYHIMAKGFSVKYPAALKVEYVLQCKATGLGKSTFDRKSTMVNARIKCHKSDLAKAKIPKPEPKPKRQKVALKRAKPLVKNISFKANPPVQYGKCPTHVDFVGHIKSNRRGTVKYRYVKHDGTQSPLFELEFNKAETLKTRKWGVTASKPKVGTQLKAASTQTSPFEVQGSYSLIIESPVPKRIKKASYKIDCDAKPNRKVSLKN
ncbi:MAG: hypothetical protein OQK04_04715 [Kangiellaceae bacterium]|nr:hypothetical protein [Kangiellaceae bacterium]MCW8997997.1 hypothetical protein [Kangiellaceae bacterium]